MAGGNGEGKKKPCAQEKCKDKIKKTGYVLSKIGRGGSNIIIWNDEKPDKNIEETSAVSVHRNHSDWKYPKLK